MVASSQRTQAEHCNSGFEMTWIKCDSLIQGHLKLFQASCRVKTDSNGLHMAEVSFEDKPHKSLAKCMWMSHQLFLTIIPLSGIKKRHLWWGWSHNAYNKMQRGCSSHTGPPCCGGKSHVSLWSLLIALNQCHCVSKRFNTHRHSSLNSG